MSHWGKSEWSRGADSCQIFYSRTHGWIVRISMENMRLKLKIFVLIVFGFEITSLYGDDQLGNEMDQELGIMFFTVHDDGLVKDEEVAAKIAKIILESIYGDVSNYEPFDIKLINDDYWFIEGAYDGGTIDSVMVGGVPAIKIKKSNGTILGYTFGE